MDTLSKRSGEVMHVCTTIGMHYNTRALRASAVQRSLQKGTAQLDSILSCISGAQYTAIFVHYATS